MDIDLIPILPNEPILFKFATPLVREKKTIGTTSIFIVLRKTSPPKVMVEIIFSLKPNGKEKEPNRIPNKIPVTKPIKIFCVKFFILLVPSTGYAPVAESYQDPVLLLN